MRAEANKTYANIINNKVSWIFTINELKEWNENDLKVVEIPKDKLDKVSVGTEYTDDFVIETPAIPTKENTTYAMLDKNNKLLYFFDSNSKKEYKQEDNVVEVDASDCFATQIGDTYDMKTKSFDIDLEHARNLYINEANTAYNATILAIMGEDTPLTEMISWETQEKEARAFLETKDETQAQSIILMAKTQGRDITEFANKIIEKAVKYRAASSFLIGYRQKVIKDLESAKDILGLKNAKFNIEFALQTLQNSQNSQNTQDSSTETETETKAKSVKKAKSPTSP